MEPNRILFGQTKGQVSLQSHADGNKTTLFLLGNDFVDGTFIVPIDGIANGVDRLVKNGGIGGSVVIGQGNDQIIFAIFADDRLIVETLNEFFHNEKIIT